MMCQLAVLMAKRDQKLSQRELARDLGVSVTTINKLYNGRPLTSRIDPEIVEKVCEYFQCEIGDLFTMEEIAVNE